jgi:hypothetical protein
MPTFTAPNALPYRSAVQTNARPAGPAMRRYPLPESCPIQFAAYAFDQEFEMVLSSFPPAAKNTQSSASSGATFGLADANAILTRLSQPSATLAGMGKFTGSFARVPASWDDFQTQSVTFPGIRDTAYNGGVRDPKPVNCTVRLRYDYFVVDPDGVLTGAGVLDSGGSAITLVTSKAKIPTLSRHRWQFLYLGSTLATSEVTGLVKSGGTGGWLETVPNTANYQTWISNAASYVSGSSAWTNTAPTVWDGSTNAGSTYGQYRITDSRLQDYEGNIVCRISEYVLAQ